VPAADPDVEAHQPPPSHAPAQPQAAAAAAAPAAGDWHTIRSLLPYLWPVGRRDLRLRVVLSLGFLILAKFGTVLIPVAYKYAVDALAQEGVYAPAAGETAPPLTLTLPLALILAYGGARLIGLGFGQLRDALFARVGLHAVRSVAVEIFTRLQHLSVAFHLNRRTGGLTRSLTRGTSAIETLLRTVLFAIAPTAIEFLLVAVILLGLFHWSFSAVVVVTVAAYLIFSVWLTAIRVKIRKEMNESDNHATTRAVDSLLNFETVKYFSNERYEAQAYDKAMARYQAAAERAQVSLAWLNLGQSVILTLGMVAVMVMAAHGIVAGDLTVGDFVMINTFMLQLAQPLGFIGFVYRELRQALVDIQELFRLKAERQDVVDAPDARPLACTGAEVKFRNVRFGYHADREILHGVSFTVPAGKTVAVVGPSGAGKSTLTRLLFRLYDPNEGEILIDGQDLRHVQQDSLRRSIGIVPQDTVLFNDRIDMNIAYGRPGAGTEEIRTAARLAEIDRFIEELPDGYGTLVGERGLKLSGGEKQRVAIARTILKNPPILILDEATSALDTRTERGIQANLSALARNRTTLVIAHRLSTIVDADEIIVMEKGRIAERGTHDALLAAQGLYAKLWAEQLEANEAGEGALPSGDQLADAGPA